MKYVTHIIAVAIAFMLAAPKAIGIALAHYVEQLPLSQFGEGGPADLKALHVAMEEAFKVMSDNVKKVQDVANNALEEVRKEGTIHGETSKKLTELSETGKSLADNYKSVQDRILEVEQKLNARGERSGNDEPKSIYDIVVNSDQWKESSSRSGAKSMDAVNIGSFHKTQIVNASGQNQPLVPSQRVAGIVTPAERRLTVRDLLPQATTTSNLIEFAVEASYTSAARPQGDVSPVGNGEGELKAESAMTFTLSNAAVTTIAHWIPASRQVLADASMLQGHISGRLIYGLKLEEEAEMLTGTGGAGTLNGLNNQAAAFTGGVTNQTAIDTLLKALLQVSLSNYEASGIVLHPTDWTNIVLLKDTTGRYLFSDPQSMTDARIWGKPVVATASQTLGKFLVGAFNLAAQVWDREDATVRISENVNDHFVRNMVAILAEERLALTVYRSASLVYGNISTAG